MRRQWSPKVGELSEAPGTDAGFTLVELLVSVALLAFLSVLLLDGMKLATSRFTRKPQQINLAQRVGALQEFLLAELADARPILDVAAPAPRIAFEGGPTQLRFLAPAPESTPLGGLMAFELRFDAPSRGSDGRLALEGGLFDVPAKASGRNTVLLDHVAKLQLSYYGALSPAAQPVWADDWSSERGLPRLVRLSASFADGSSMPDLVIALRLSAPPPAAIGRGWGTRGPS
ncbi:MAG TPA: prepilin-type N-terminal cleavage/methylation domain-containing protein [Stellaceae bacterium]|jgi:general secretion pathway protein J|nr:prepilin-type N-terminal cleavage/methylation domain-containing protein [Stellaceae bacterium]